jgi:hypothetical protein
MQNCRTAFEALRLALICRDHRQGPSPVKCVRIGKRQFAELLEGETRLADRALEGKRGYSPQGFPFYVDETFDGMEIEYFEGEWTKIIIAEISAETGIPARAY